LAYQHWLANELVAAFKATPWFPIAVRVYVPLSTKVSALFVQFIRLLLGIVILRENCITNGGVTPHRQCCFCFFSHVHIPSRKRAAESETGHGHSQLHWAVVCRYINWVRAILFQRITSASASAAADAIMSSPFGSLIRQGFSVSWPPDASCK